MVRKTRTLNKNVEVVEGVRKDYLLIEINIEEHLTIDNYFTGKDKLSTCPLTDINIGYSSIHMFGKPTSSKLTNDIVKKFIDKAMLEFRWHNVRDIFVQGIIEADRNYPREFMTQSAKTPLEVFKAHVEKLGNPAYIVVASIPHVKDNTVKRTLYDNINKDNFILP